MPTLSIPIGTYKKDGEEKTNFETIWRIVTKENGKTVVKLSPIVTNYLKQLFWPSFEGWVNIFDDKKKDEEQTREVSRPPPVDDDLPFRKS